MKKAQWICRYVYLGILLALSIAFCVYCAVTVNNIESSMKTTAFLDSLPESIVEAYETLDELHYFRDLFETSKTVLIIPIVFIVVMILYHIIGNIVIKKLEERKNNPKPPKEKKQKKQTVPQYDPNQPMQYDPYSQPYADPNQQPAYQYDPNAQTVQYPDSYSQPYGEPAPQPSEHPYFAPFVAPAEEPAQQQNDPYAAYQQPVEPVPVYTPTEDAVPAPPAEYVCPNCKAVFYEPTPFCGFCGTKM